MSEYKIYHNPRCSKSRETLEILRSKGVEPTIIEYLKTPPSQEEILGILRKLGGEASQLVRTKEQEFSDSGIDLSSAESVSQGIAATPKLLERPIVVKKDRAVIGRPPSNVETLIS